MAWAKLDDSVDTHPKVRRAGNEAFGLHCRAIAYSTGQLTDGHIDPEWVRERAGSRAKRLVDALVGAGLWEANGDGWLIHDYLDHNPSRAQVLERRRAESERKAGGR